MSKKDPCCLLLLMLKKGAHCYVCLNFDLQMMDLTYRTRKNITIGNSTKTKLMLGVISIKYAYLVYTILAFINVRTLKMYFCFAVKGRD